MTSPVRAEGGASRLVLMKCLLAAATIEALLRTVSLPRVCSLLGIAFKSGASREQAFAPPVLSVQRIASQVDDFYRRYPLPDTCLRRALVAGRLLVDHRPELVIGVRTAPNFEAHAWLVVGGGVLDWSNRHAEFKRL